MYNENEKENNVGNNTYNRSNVNLNISLSNPNLDIDDSMSVNIVNNSSSMVNYQNTKNVDKTNINNINSNNNENYDYGNLYEKKDLNVNLSQTLADKNNESISSKNIRNSEKTKISFNIGELKFVFLIFLIFLILIMFFPNISEFFSELINNR